MLRLSMGVDLEATVEPEEEEPEEKEEEEKEGEEVEAEEDKDDEKTEEESESAEEAAAATGSEEDAKTDEKEDEVEVSSTFNIIILLTIYLLLVGRVVEKSRQCILHKQHKQYFRLCRMLQIHQHYSTMINS